MSKFKPLSNPILFLSDRPEDVTGLARIARDLASLACTLPELRVGFLGRGGQGLRKFPWCSYSYPEAIHSQWGQNYLAGVTKDFFGSEHGIVFTNWDISRLGWLTGQGLTPDLAKAYGPSRNFDLWLYTPVDGLGIDGQRLGVEARNTLPVFNRVMAASEWGCNVLKNSGRPDAEWLPHGLDLKTFVPDLKAREKLGWDKDGIFVMSVMANQSRKDFPAAFETAALLKAHYGNRFKFHLHTDIDVRHWNIYALAADYGVQDCVEISARMTDAELALRYSACDCTILPSAGEGFSYTTAESLACGTSQIVTDYAAAQELVPEDCRVKPVTMRVDTIHNVQRAVLSGYGFAAAAINQIDKKRSDPEYRGDELRATVEHLGWDRLRFSWERWFREGLRG